MTTRKKVLEKSGILTSDILRYCAQNTKCLNCLCLEESDLGLTAEANYKISSQRCLSKILAC